MEPNSHLEWKNGIYAPGSLEAQAYRGGLVVATQRIETTSAPYALRLVPDQASMGKDQPDIYVVNIEVIDDKERVVPDADNEVSFHIEGSATIIGVGNGCPSSHQADHASYRRAFNGFCQVILKGSRDAGQISISVTSPGLRQDRITIG
jgi:beta-galactosidase